ncbi:hypothetical protein JW960_12285 [candidate division KSB1 bacterium]|nr:hypothetical protein [candidate division KSB1 bacterium]
MNVRTKSGLIIVLTLCIGFALGMLTDRSLVRSQFQKRLSNMRNPRGLSHMIERIINPSDEQSEKINGIIDRYTKQIHDINEQSRQKVITVMDSLDTALDSVLTDEQKQQFDEHIKRMKEMRSNRFPPPPHEGRRGHRNPPDDDFPPPPPPPPGDPF